MSAGTGTPALTDFKKFPVFQKRKFFLICPKRKNFLIGRKKKYFLKSSKRKNFLIWKKKKTS